MPELPEVESIVRALRPCIEGKTIREVRILDERLLENAPASRLPFLCRGQSIAEIRRRGKFIIFRLGNDSHLLTHLRMTGKYLYSERERAPQRHTRLIIDFSDGSQLHYHDLRRFGRIAFYPGRAGVREALSRLGPEPLGDEFDARYLWRKSRQSARAIKQLLLDQAVVAGIGNIYASEILFQAQISPFRSARQLKFEEIERIIRASRRILSQAIQCLGTTFSDYRTPGGGKGGFQERLQVYGRQQQPCPRCKQPIQRLTQAQRSTFFCPSCQQ